MAGKVRSGRGARVRHHGVAIVVALGLASAGLVGTTIAPASGANQPLNILTTERVNVSNTGAQLSGAC